MPKKFPPEFRRDVVTVARRGELTRAEVAADFGISEQSEIVQLRRDKRRVEMEVEILRRATAFFARDHLPK